MPSNKEAEPTATGIRSQTRTRPVDVLKLCKWAKKNGAVSIKVEGVEILFPPPELQPDFQLSNEARPIGVATRESHPWLAETMTYGEAAAPSATKKPQPAISSKADNPDVYAADLDAWANQRPLGRR